MDDSTGKFYFLEMNTRLQVEHPVTEVTHPGLDIVELMILQGLVQRESPLGGLPPEKLDQEKFGGASGLHAIELRVYCENPTAGFQPSPGVIQHVSFPNGDGWEWLRVDSWIRTGTTVTPYFDPLVAKLIVNGGTRAEVISRLEAVLDETRICGPPNNLAYLKGIVQNDVWRAGRATTTFLNSFQFIPK